MLGMAKGESNIRGRNKVEHTIESSSQISQSCWIGGRGTIETLFACLKMPRANWDVVSCNMCFSMFLSKGDLGCQSTFDIFFSLSKDELELGCCTLEEYLSDAYDEHTM